MPIPKGCILYDSTYLISEKQKSVETQDRLMTVRIWHPEGAAEKGATGKRV